MKSLNYYKYQLETFKKLKENCTNKATLKKIDNAISKYQQLIENYDFMSQLTSEDECHCELCVMQG